jgi:hypothetical protein
MIRPTTTYSGRGFLIVMNNGTLINLLYFKCEYQSHTASANATDTAAPAHHGEQNSDKVGAWLRRS